MRRLLALLALLGLAACATSPPAAQSVLRSAQAGAAPFVLNGRIAVTHGSEHSSATVHWTHRGPDDEILLLAPLGQTVARIKQDAYGVELQTSSQHFVAQDAAELTQQALGWSLPLDGLRYWVLALSAPDTQAQVEHDANGQVSVLHQDGWTIHYTRYAALAPDSLPLRMSLEREGLELRLLIDEWQMQ